MDNKKINFNIYDVLYMSDSSDEENETLKAIPQKKKIKKQYLCNPIEKKNICRNSYKNIIYNSDNTIINKNILLIKKYNKNIC